MKSKFDICDEVNCRFKELIDENKNHYLEKFRHLPYWLDEVSYYFLLESQSKLPKHYYYFKRGSIIRVNFGVNEGSEFSNIHFAIVLDKKDSKYKRTLTVLPLTSKQKNGRYSLGKEVFNQTTTVLVKNINDQQVALLNIMKERDLYVEKNKEISSRIVTLNEEFNKFIQELKQLKSKKDINNTALNKQEKLENKQQKISKEISSLEEDQKLNDKLAQRIENEIADVKKEIKQLEKVVSIYQKYNKNSYVRLSDITTISKLRIERINKFDPSGKIRLTSEQMRGISDQLMKLYISN